VRSLWVAILSTFAAKGYGAVVELGTLIVTARLLGAHGRGVLAAILAWVGLYSALFGLSLSQVVVHRLSRADAAQFNRTFAALVIVTAPLASAAWGFAAATYHFTAAGGLTVLPVPLLVLGFAMVPLFMWESYSSHLLSAINRLWVYNFGQVAGRTLGFVVMLAAILYAGLGLYGPVLGAITSQIIVITTAVVGMYSLLRWPLRTHRGELGSLLLSGLKLHANTIGAYLLTQMDIVMLSQFRSVEEVAWYQAAAQLNYAFLLLPAVISLVLLGKTAQTGPDEVWRLQRILVAQVTLLLAALGLLCYFAAPQLIVLILGTPFDEAVPIFQILLLAMVGMGFANLMVPQWIGRGLFLQASLLTIVVGLMNVALNAVFIPHYGMYAAAWTTVVSFTISIVSNGIFALWVDQRVRGAMRGA
jgi:O-antigen/teichoic acid export membrane protein